MSRAALMVQGTGSDVGKSVVVAGLCRLLRRRGIAVAPFKPQNMSNNAAACPGGGEIGRAQALQARAAGLQPEVDMNPVLLKPQTDRASQLVVQGRAVSTVDAARYVAERGSLLAPIMASFERLAAAFDLVLVEGAGSPAETNLRARDVANMGFARRAGVPVCLLGDIDRGGVIAALVGTRAVLEPADRRMVASFAVNKFRGDPALFEAGVRDIERRTGWPCRGVIPWSQAALRLPGEDAVVLQRTEAPSRRTGERVRVVVPLLSRIANFDDFDPLRMEPAVDFAFIPPGSPLPRDADVVIVPGTKSTLGDLAFLRAQGWHHDLIAHARTGGRVFGVCGGYQMLGRMIRDPAGADGAPGEAPGLGLLDVETVMTNDKAVRPVTGICMRNGSRVSGYEIHLGATTGPDTERPVLRLEHGPDGAASRDGRVAGCYVHGLFAGDAFRARWLDDIRAGSAATTAYEDAVEAALDALADCLAEALDVRGMLADAGLRGSF
ncbi:MAG: cobyric acid synthase [Spirochaetaceae bacterium]|nr:cobyric acid synthase [Spirochaetaceae bacterium]